MASRVQSIVKPDADAIVAVQCCSIDHTLHSCEVTPFSGLHRPMSMYACD